MFDELIDELFDGLVAELVPDHPAALYGLPTVLLGGGLAVAANPVPVLAIAVGLLLSGGLLLAYEYTELERESTGGERSTADWIVLGVFALLVGGIVVGGELDSVTVSLVQVLGLATGLLAGASVVEWIAPALLERLGSVSDGSRYWR